jgi:threonine/homoserine/homoserine lactone efflux protein
MHSQLLAFVGAAVLIALDRATGAVLIGLGVRLALTRR